MDASVFQQAGHRVRFEWGEYGARTLARDSSVVIIVDVLSFTTCVDIAVSRDCVVYPYPFKDASAERFADSIGAKLAGKRGTVPSLSPAAMTQVAPRTKIVLPSQNGAECTLAAANAGSIVIAGCLRNASAIANYAKSLGDGVISVIACGERWEGSGALRPSFEDLVGAGAILSHFSEDEMSIEARTAVYAFRSVAADLASALCECTSGRELMERGFLEDVTIASQLNVSKAVPRLIDGKYM
jgi:2-phosphosulfolactate phosphatase